MKKIQKITKEFAYILGVIYGDGYCRSRKSGGEIILKVKDEDFAIYFKNCLEKWSGLKAKLKCKDDFFHTVLYSKERADFVLNFKLNSILKAQKEIQFNFLSGLFDSDGGILGKNLKNRRIAKRWIHFSNNNKEIIDLVSTILNKQKIKYFISSRIHSGFGSKKLQYEIKIYNLKDLFYFYNNIKFNIGRKQKKLKEVINSYDYYPRSLFNNAKKLHKEMGYRKVAQQIRVPKGVVYGWLFKDNQKQILNVEEMIK